MSSEKIQKIIKVSNLMSSLLAQMSPIEKGARVSVGVSSNIDAERIAIYDDNVSDSILKETKAYLDKEYDEAKETLKKLGSEL